MLERLLYKLCEQTTNGLFSYSIVVTDNDREQSARRVVSTFQSTASVMTTYCVEPQQNIAMARNRALANATGDFLAFIDDDEFPAPDWLATLLVTCQGHAVGGVLGPVRPFFEEPAPEWLLRGRFCERPEYKTGEALDWRQTRTGNALIHRQILADLPGPFRRELGNGGEDQDFFKRLIERGYRFIWCNEAVVFEAVPQERWRKSYFLRRAFLRGQNEREFLTVSSLAKSAVALLLYGLTLPVLLLVRDDLFMQVAIRFMDHAGKLATAMRIRPLGGKYLTP